MPRFELECSVAFIVVAIISSVVFFSDRPREGNIKLPVHDEDAESPEGSYEVFGGQQTDPFDVTKPVDVVDGEPLDGDKFWAQARKRKLVLLAVLTLCSIVQTTGLGWCIVTNEPMRIITTRSLELVYTIYVVALAMYALTQSQVYTHWRTIIHISVLTSLAFATMGIIALLPYPNAAESVSQPVLTGLWYTSLTLWLLSAIISSRTKRGPQLYFPSELIYSEKILSSATNFDRANVCGIADGSVMDIILFSYTTKVVMLGYKATSLEVGDLPIVPANMRATTLFAIMRRASKAIKLRGNWRPRPGSGWELIYRLLKVNQYAFMVQFALVVISASLFYAPAFFLQQLVRYLENDPERVDPGWGWVYCAGLFGVNAVSFLVTGQLWSISTTTLQVRLRIQLNTILFAKTLVRKDVASSSGSAPADEDGKSKLAAEPSGEEKKDDEGEFSSKAQIMTLMTTDVDRVSEFAWHLFALFDSPIEICIGTFFLYKLLGPSCFFGLAVTCLFLPINHFASKVVVKAQDRLMSARDERVALMNEVLGAIRMLKFMAWERSFEARILNIRVKELKFQRLNYLIEVLFTAVWNASPLLVTLVSFWHFAVFRQQVLSPSIAFTSLAVFNEMKFALNALPETFINMLQSFVSLRRIEKYLNSAEVSKVPSLDGKQERIALQSASITWPQLKMTDSAASSAASTPRRKFILTDLSLEFPPRELSLVCGKLGSGKTLLLLSLLGEADLLAGQILSPRSPPDAIASLAGEIVPPEEWILPGLCAYVPQTAWLQNASIKENILFNLPMDEERYEKTLEVCALLADLKILEDGDDSEIGERGVNLSGGQKARVSLARAVYSRASVLLLDDVLSAVDAHTAHHLFNECLKGPLMKGRTIILVSHHVQLCVDGAAYVVALDNGRLSYAGDKDGFKGSGILATLVQSEGAKDEAAEAVDAKGEKAVEDLDIGTPPSSASDENDLQTDTSSTAAASTNGASSKSVSTEKRKPRKLIEEEKRAVGRISKDIWKTYVLACGSWPYWVIFALGLVTSVLSPVAENWWLKFWSAAAIRQEESRSPLFYLLIYALITVLGLFFITIRWFILYTGSIHASTVLYKRLLESVLFAQIRFHDTVSRGRLLNRFGKDFEGIDSSLSDNFGRSIFYFLSICTSVVTVSVVGGPPFIIAAALLGVLYWNVAKVYGQCSRDMRRLDSVSRSPLYSIYGETIAGVASIRAYGASSKFLRDMLRCVDTNANPYYWMWGVNRWLSARFNLLSSVVVGVTGVVLLMTPSVDASLAGFALGFAATATFELLFMVRRFVGLEQSMVALERVKEFSILPKEGPEFVEPRPPQDWPSQGSIECENLVIRYAPDLPNVLHGISFTIQPCEKVGILGRTGSGKSTLALSFFRFVEATEGRICVDDVDISKIGLTDLRSKLTIIPQDPTIFSGTLRSTLDVFNEYSDADLFEALRRVHLIPSEDVTEESEEGNANVFRNLDSSVSESGDNFSTGEKQLLCMARAILKRSKVLVMDEATASVDYATDELISKTIRHEFAGSTILTIAHRLRTVIDYNRIMLLDNGKIVEFDKPAVLLSDPNSRFYALCKATGKEEFAVLKKMAGL